MSRRCITTLLVLAVALGAGCEPYRVEYRTLPSFYRDAAGGNQLPERVTLADGTTVVYQTRSFGGPPERGGIDKDEVFEPVVEHDDGSIELHAILPEHLLGNLMYCLRNEKYEACWDQVLSETTRQAMAAAGEGYDEFAAFLQRNRRDLLITTNRMLLGLPRQDVLMEPAGNGVIRMKFRPRVAETFHFRRIDMVTEGFELKLLVIR